MSENRKQVTRWIPVLEVLFFAFFTYYARGILDAYLVEAQMDPLWATVLRILLLVGLIALAVGLHTLISRFFPRREE